jgi:thiamine monophosphate kinase
LRTPRGSRTPLWHALHDGEDYELVATLSSAALARARKAIASLTVIGRVVRGRGLCLVDGPRSRAWRPAQGAYEHGR